MGFLGYGIFWGLARLLGNDAKVGHAVPCFKSYLTGYKCTMFPDMHESIHGDFPVPSLTTGGNQACAILNLEC